MHTKHNCYEDESATSRGHMPAHHVICYYKIFFKWNDRQKKTASDEKVVRSVEGLKDCTQSFNPSKDHAILGRVEGSHAILQPVEGLHMILQPIEGLHLQSLEGVKDCMWSFNPSKDCIHDPWKGWRIACHPSTRRRIVSFNPQGSHSWSLEGLKDHM